MIVSYRNRRTERFAKGEHVKEFSGFARRAEVRLDRLDAAISLKDLGMRLEPLHGDREGQYSIRINDQWRICFEWPTGSPGPTNVELQIAIEEKQYGADPHSSRRASRRRA